MLRKAFKECQSGNIAVLFALSLLPVISLVGLAVDYSRAQNVRIRMNVAADAAALALAHSSVNLSSEDLQKKADELFLANFGNGDAAVTPGPVEISRNHDILTVNATAEVSTAFLKIVNINSLDIRGASKVVWGGTDIEVVLALDNTGSMAGTKLNELKKAARELIDTLEETTHTPGAVKIGLVPFATTVRVDPDTNENSEWIHFPDRTIEDEDDDDDRNGEHGRDRDDDDDDRRGHRDDDDDDRNRSRPIPFDKQAWRGCIQDRDQDYDVGDASYDRNRVNTLYPAVQDCPSQERNLATVRPLTTDFDTLREAVDDMKAAGNTNVTIGIAWGLSLLSSKPPYAEGSAETGRGKTQKYLIVLTDGENTKNRFSSSTSAIDARTAMACSEARNAGTIFTIRVIDGDEGLLRACASDSSNYYNVQNAGEMTPVFRAIANEIAQLRIAQ